MGRQSKFIGSENIERAQNNAQKDPFLFLRSLPFCILSHYLFYIPLVYLRTMACLSWTNCLVFLLPLFLSHSAQSSFQKGFLSFFHRDYLKPDRRAANPYSQSPKGHYSLAHSLNASHFNLGVVASGHVLALCTICMSLLKSKSYLACTIHIRVAVHTYYTINIVRASLAFMQDYLLCRTIL